MPATEMPATDTSLVTSGVATSSFAANRFGLTASLGAPTAARGGDTQQRIEIVFSPAGLSQGEGPPSEAGTTLLPARERGRRAERGRLLSTAVISCATWAELCGLLRGAWVWARGKYPSAEIEGPDVLRWGAMEFVPDAPL